jgi:hypothetical protein
MLIEWLRDWINVTIFNKLFQYNKIYFKNGFSEKNAVFDLEHCQIWQKLYQNIGR